MSSACVHIKAVSLEDKHSATWSISHTTLLTDVGWIVSDYNSDKTSDAYDSTISGNTYRAVLFHTCGSSQSP